MPSKLQSSARLKPSDLERLKAAIAKNGKDWLAVSREMGGAPFTPSRVSIIYTNKLDPDISREPWSEKEDSLLLAWTHVRSLKMQKFKEYIHANLRKRSPDSAYKRYHNLTRKGQNQAKVLGNRSLPQYHVTVSSADSVSTHHHKEQPQPPREVYPNTNISHIIRVDATNYSKQRRYNYGGAGLLAKPLHKDPKGISTEFEAILVRQAQTFASLFGEDKTGVSEEAKQSMNNWLAAYANRRPF